MRFGVLTLPTAPWSQQIERWRYLDDLGWDAIYVADGLAHPRDPSLPWFDGWICLATAAQVTKRARLGMLVTSIIFRNPAEIVHAAIAVDHASNGRMELGVGSGDSEFDHALAEVPNWSARERARRFRDYVARVRGLLDGADERLNPRGIQARIPLVVAAQGPKALRIAAEFADKWNTYGGRRLSAEEGREVVRRLAKRFDAALAENGRDARDVRRSVLLGTGFIAEEPFRSEDAFKEVAEAWREIGMDEIVFYDPPERNAPPGTPVDRDLYERIVREVMPTCS
jgi:alkanesulfonate monooxygenase SsuD/methylene tetrahydromethanopterin reductase-like flavin-dependent oxidoreductase (luciferase family)